MYLACAAFVAATLQGSRLPEDATDARTALARADAAMEHRAGSGADKDEYPPLSDSTLA